MIHEKLNEVLIVILKIFFIVLFSKMSEYDKIKYFEINNEYIFLQVNNYVGFS